MRNPTHRTTRAGRPLARAAAIALVLVVAGGCTSKQEVRAAYSSAYDADFAVVFSETLAAVRELYPNLDDDPTAGKIKTAWHQVQFSTGENDPRSQQARDRALGVGNDVGTFTTPASASYKRLFIRFDITVTGGRPWRVRVHAKASEWEPGNALPTELRGANAPHWLPGRRDALAVAIYRRLKGYAVQVEEEAPIVDEDPVPEVDPSVFGAIPAPAAATAAAIVKAVDGRDAAALRAQLADDVVWSLGAPGSADTALAMWQADPATLETLASSLRAGCVASSETVVVCPAAVAEQPGYVGWRVTLEQRGTSWKLTEFVQGE